MRVKEEGCGPFWGEELTEGERWEAGAFYLRVRARAKSKLR
jgi:hypothetical protein